MTSTSPLSSRRLSSPQAMLLATLLATTALSGVPQALAQSLPTGGRIAAGSATIGTPANGALTVTQSSQNAVVNWQGFSVGQGNSVNFVQPSSSAAILNRVTGSTPSTIAGAITANGQVYLVNPNGIAITATGTVNAAGFVASTLAIGDDDFMAGRRNFTGDGASATVSNAGAITIGRGGYAALLGGAVDNAGAITVPLGKVGLGSGEQATLDLSGDGFLQVAIPTRAEESGAQGTKALVSHSGKISTAGGVVQISVAAAKDAARQAINLSGAVEAKTVAGRSGDVVLGGGAGEVEISGTVTATGSKGTGGSITVTGGKIALKGAALDASGKKGGGSIKVGGGRQGKGTLPHADTVTVDAKTTIKADATSAGNGGDVVVWSDRLTSFDGVISAQGGALSGDGGQAEVSGKAKLAYTGFTDLSAARGAFGTLLLDPYNVTISTDSDANHTSFTATADNSVINATTLLTALGGANVTVSTSGSGGSGTQAGDITVATPLTWSANTVLTLDAYHAIAINADISITGGGGLTLTTNNGGTGGDLTFAKGASASFAAGQSGQTLTINGDAHTLLYSMADIDGIDSTASSANTINNQAGGLSGKYALAQNLDASGVTYTDALVSGSFIGIFEGLGHTITGLTINKTTGSYAGLFSGVGDLVTTGVVVRNVGLVGGSVHGNMNVGGLAGIAQNALITNVFSSAEVSGTSKVGGLVGYNYTGTLDNVYATGAVSGNSTVGGLVGQNDATISNAYATGAISASNSVGGLVGFNVDTITNAYATGAVSGNLIVGGLVGNNNNNTGTVSNVYWDTQTSGASTGIATNTGTGSPTGLTTANVQTATAATNLGSAFSGGAGLYPYLASFFPGGVQAVTGTAYKDAGVTVAASGSSGAVTVTGFANGTAFGAATTGANGYYYIAEPAGSFNTGDSLLTYTTANATTGATNAATVGTATAASVQSGLNIYGGAVTVPTAATTLSGAPTLAAARTSAIAAAGNDATASAAINAATGRGFVATGASFTVDQAVTTGASFVVQTVTGAPLTVSNPVTVQSGGSLGLLSGGTLAINAAVTVQGADTVTLAYDTSSATNFTFGNGAGLTYTDAAGSAITSSAGGSLTINGDTYTLLYSMADIDGVDGAAASTNPVNNQAAGLSGKYALARSLDASGVTYTNPVTGVDSGNPFAGVLEGLGNTITGLTIARPSGDYTGLIGYTGGTVRDISLIGGSVSGVDYVGSLAGFNYGTIANVYSSAAVSGHTAIGGLVARNNNGTIINAMAAGSVTASHNTAGGFIGYFETGSITNAIATGTVKAINQSGGFAGTSFGTLTNIIATGAVITSNNTNVGGVIGFGTSPANNVYWDTQTSGQGSSAIGAGLTTAQLQDGGASATGLGSAFTLSSGLYPYLTSAFPDGVKAISGIAYKDAGGTAAASGSGGAVTVTGFANGAAFGTAATGVNGYYYIAGPVGSFNTGDSLLTYTTANATTGVTNAATIGTATAASVQSGLNIYGGAVTVPTTATTLSGTPTLAAARTSAIAAAGNDATASAAINAATGRGFVATGASFTVDQAVTTGASFVVQTATGAPLTVSSPITVQSGGSLGLLSGGTLAINAAIAVQGADTVTLAYDTSSATNFTFGNGAGLTYTDAAGSAITSSVGGSLTINGNAYTLLYSMADIDGIDGAAASTNPVNNQAAGLSGKYALARSLDASGVTYTNALVGVDGSHLLLGIFEGLGHAISGLTINKSGDFAGLFGFVGSGGLVRDIGLLGGSVSGNQSVGALVAINRGTVANVYATGAVTGTNNVGGLVGYSEGTVSNAYATGAVSGTTGAGGLVGTNNLGAISNAYATGAVSGSGGYAGGLAGQNFDGTISNVYATGAVVGAGNSIVGGLLGYNANGTLSQGYWDTQTSGQSVGTGANLTGQLPTGQTTAQLQTTIAAGNLGSAFSGAVGLYPYLASFFPGGMQAVSGTAPTGGTVHLRADTGGVATASAGANGYYYIALPAGSIAGGGSSLLAWSTGAAANGATFQTGVTAGRVAAFDITGDKFNEITGLTTLSGLNTAYTTASNGSGISGTFADRSITASGSFAIDTGLAAAGTVSVGATGDLTIGAAGTVGGTGVTLSATGAFVNNRGSDAVTATTDRWLIYSANSAGDTFGSLDSGNTAVWNTAAGATVGISGNRYVFAEQPTLTVTTVNAGKTYGDAAGATPSAYYAATGPSGVTGAYRADTVATILSGSPSLSSSGFAAGADAGSYGYTLGLGTLTATGGYAISLVNTGRFTVNPRNATVAADAQSRAYGDTNPILSYAVSGLVNGDTLSGSLATTATGTSGVGTYAITQGTLAASGNYSVAFTSANLTVTARPITVTADAKSRVYGDANPSLTYSVGGSGLVNGDVLSGGLNTAATATSGVGAYAVTQGSLANANYVISYTGANLTVTPAESVPPVRPLENVASLLVKDQALATLAVPLMVSTQSELKENNQAGTIDLIAGFQFNSVFVCISRALTCSATP